MSGWSIVLATYGTMSAITFVTFKLDKDAAAKDRRRTPEATLHVLELLGGWPGGLIAMLLLRHKNRKTSYIALLACIALLHVAAWCFVLY